MQNYWILFVRDFEILAPLLIKLRPIKHDRVWKKKVSVKNLERAKPGYSEQGTDGQGRES